MRWRLRLRNVNSRRKQTRIQKCVFSAFKRVETMEALSSSARYWKPLCMFLRYDTTLVLCPHGQQTEVVDSRAKTPALPGKNAAVLQQMLGCGIASGKFDFCSSAQSQHDQGGGETSGSTVKPWE